MRIKDVEFAGAIAKPGGVTPAVLGSAAPAGLPEVAFSGRSNVGKSSLINRLLGRTRTPIARVSQTPGKTQQINFFQVRAALSSGDDTRFFLVDLPGYGYAKVPDAVRRAWQPLIERYLERSTRLRGVVQLIDARHDPTADDRLMVDYLASRTIPVLLVLTKADKLKASERAARFARSAERLGVSHEELLPFSARSGEGRETLLDSLDALLTEETT
ncbi:MAG: ribosome biogenesis GTP-binding protein YihA/YsxC, partial [Longimicrobiales bacterium]